jgi:hypothetical protein
MRNLLATGLLVAMACRAAAQGELAEETWEDWPAPPTTVTVGHGWHNFEKGAWVEVRIREKEGDKVVERTERRTLRALEKEGAALVSVAENGKEAAAVVQSFDDVFVPRPEFGPKSYEVRDVAGANEHCHISESKTEGKAPPAFRGWFGSYTPAPGNLLRSERRGADGSVVVREVVEMGRFVEFAGRRVFAMVWSEVETRADGRISMRLEEVQSPDVPGGLVSRKVKRYGVRDGKPWETEIEEVATQFLEDASGMAEEARRGCDAIRARFRSSPTHWRGFAEGSSVTMRSQTWHRDGTTWVQVNRDRLAKIKPGGFTREYDLVEGWHKPTEPVTHHSTSAGDFRWGWWSNAVMSVRPLGPETVKSCGKDWACEAYAVEIEYSGDLLNPQIRSVSRRNVWRCTSFPVNDGIVKEETGHRRGKGEIVITETTTVADLDRVIPIGGKDYHAYVLRTVTDDDRSPGMGETETSWSDDVPGGQVRFERWETTAGKRERIVLMEAVEVDAKRAK